MTLRHGPPERRGRRLGGEDGAVMVEFALMAPLLVILVLGIVEYGSILRNETTVTGAVRNAARVGAQYKDDALGDLNALSSLYASIGSAQRLTINRVVIYRSDVATGAPPAACLSVNVTSSPTSAHGSSADNCNVYSAAQVAGAATAPASSWSAAGDACGSSRWDGFWCPSVRKASLVGGDSPPDYMGLYISVTYTPITGLVPTTTTFTDYAVNRLEPDV